MTSSTSIEDLRQAFMDWHKPIRLASSPIGKLGTIAQRISALPNQHPQAVVGVIQSALLTSMQLMQDERWIRLANYRDAVRGKPLLWLYYVDEQPIHKICSDLNISQATLYRYFALELEALADILNSAEEGRLTPAIQHTQSSSQLSLYVPVLPADYILRSSHIDNAIQVLTSNPANNIALVGLPGSGKTTLAIAIARHPTIQQHFPDGVLWIDVGPSETVERCLRESLATLNIATSQANLLWSRQSLASQLRTALSSKRMLVIIDDVWDVNASHALMAGNAGSRHVVTTRSPAIAYALAGISVINIAEFSFEETKQLFSSYLGGISASSVGDEQIAFSDAALESMNRLPLNVVLIGRHLRYLSNTHQQHRLIEAIQQINVLTPQQTIDVLDKRIEASVHALSLPARTAIECLAIFQPKPNSFNAADALAVAECTHNVLNEIIDAGLVEPWHGRLAMHASIQHYFIAKSNGILHLALERMGSHYLHSLRTASVHFGTEDSANIATAITHAASTRNAVKEADLIWQAAWLFEEAGQIDLLSQWIQHASSREVPAEQALALSIEAARITWLQGKIEEAIPRLQSCLEETRRLGLNDLHAFCEHTLSYIQVEHHQLEAGIAGAHEAYDREPAAKHVLDKSEIAAVRQLVMRMRFDSLRNMMARIAVKLAGKQTQRADIVLANVVVAWLDYLSGNVATVEHRFRLALASPHAQTHSLIAAITNGALARLCCLEGRYAEALSFARRFDEPAIREASPEFTALSYEVQGSVDIAMSHMDSAQRRLAEGLAYTRTHDNPLLRAVLLTSLCELHLRMGKFASAQTLAEQAMQIAGLATDPIMRCDATVAAASSASALGRMDEADQLFLRAKDAGAFGTAKANPWAVMHWHMHHAQHAVRKLALDIADADHQAVIALAQRLRARAHEGRAWFERGQIALRKGILEDASSFGRRGLEMLTEIGHADAIEVSKWLYDNKLTGHAE